ncbi:hypothetical protein HETIRDRAFT_330819 [Heterobasidion irregulare TC 32-1]|uniref:Sucrase/ferredoxin-like-domain-containing protein n=1 Tax=Heterobasidion irregulare (strain TC 32-1) TaxID=747525 RepID=W4JNV5_HETIT|nr:uncharacterized protein HETIRDRAFT_330819 [Heterobasidion irregulare TC 32-1]ETW75223.1 hypothetical protein HETIRDRAFT_330819 [Heterobasidion irregulare TC 32-1]
MLSRAVTTRPIHILHPRLLSTSTPPNASVDSLVGTAPTHNVYIFLHSQHRPKDFPAALPSPLRSALQLRAREWRGLVNFAWNPAYPNPYDFIHRTATGGGEVCSATAFVTGRHSNSRLDIPSVSIDNVDSVAEKVKQHVVASLSSLEPDPPRPVLEGQDWIQADDTVYLYVCTHGAKDCRCGDWGGQVADALRTEVWKRGLEGAGLGKRVVVSEVGHVGGHKYAANLLVYPFGDWYYIRLGNVRTEDVPTILDTILARPHRHRQSNERDVHPPLCLPHWRGRMGLLADEQVSLYKSHAQNS